MNIKVKNREEIYEMNFLPITQLCGKNIVEKAFVIDSLEQYFSLSRYMEYEQAMIDNILVDDEAVGRKYFDVTVIRSREDLINQLKITKTGRVKKHIDKILAEYCCQVEVEKLEQIINNIFDEINIKFLKGDSDLMLTYKEENLFDMFLCSELKAIDGRILEELTNIELLENYLKLIEEEQHEDGKKTMLIFENVDHLLNRKEYLRFMESLTEVVTKSDLWCVVSTSLEGYTFLDEEYFTGINCVNDIIYTMADYAVVKEYVEFNYPVNKLFSDKEFKLGMETAIHNIGADNHKYDLRGYIIERLINTSVCTNVCEKSNMTLPEKNFL